MAIQEFTLTGADGTPIFCRRLIAAPAKAVLLFVHGIHEHGGRYTRLMEFAEGRGWTSYAPDHRGHGRTARCLGDIESFDKVRDDLAVLVKKVEDEHPGLPIFLYGHSLGGLIALHFLLLHQARVRGAVLSAASIDLPDNVPPILVKLAPVVAAIFPRLPVQTFDSTFVCRNPEEKAAYDTDPLVYRGKVRARTGAKMIGAIREVRAGLPSITVPLLILHGGDDRIVPISSSRTIETKAGSTDKTFHEFPRLFHEIHNDPQTKDVYDIVGAWISQRI